MTLWLKELKGLLQQRSKLLRLAALKSNGRMGKAAHSDLPEASILAELVQSLIASPCKVDGLMHAGGNGGGNGGDWLPMRRNPDAVGRRRSCPR